jgi:hypothetical protein
MLGPELGPGLGGISRRVHVSTLQCRKTPGCGSLLAAVEASVDGQVEAMIAGLPSQLLLHRVLDKFALDPAKTLVVGGNLSEEIAWANAGAEFGGGLHMVPIHWGDRWAHNSLRGCQ